MRIKTVVDRFFLYDKRLSWKAKGILYFIIANEGEYAFTKKLLISHSSCRRMSVDSGLEELEKYGYLKVEDTGAISLKTTSLHTLLT